jgi:hypothetical protein
MWLGSLRIVNPSHIQNKLDCDGNRILCLDCGSVFLGLSNLIISKTRWVVMHNGYCAWIVTLTFFCSWICNFRLCAGHEPDSTRRPSQVRLPAVHLLLLQVEAHLPRALRLAVRLASRPLILQVLLHVVRPIRRLVALLPSAPVRCPALSLVRFHRQALIPSLALNLAHLCRECPGLSQALLIAEFPVSFPVVFLAHHHPDALIYPPVKVQVLFQEVRRVPSQVCHRMKSPSSEPSSTPSVHPNSEPSSVPSGALHSRVFLLTPSLVLNRLHLRAPSPARP